MMNFIRNMFNTSPDEETEIDLMNKLMDIIINHAKEYHLIQFDPFILRQRQTINFNAYATLIINNLQVTGATNFKKISNNTNISLKGEKRFTIGSDVDLTDLKIDVNFDAKLGVPKYRIHLRQKTACITIKRCVFYFEFVVNVSEKFVKLNKVMLISNDKIVCKTEGFIWPFNMTADTLIRKNIEEFICDNQNVLEDMTRKAANQFCDPHDVYHELKKNNEFTKIIRRINFD